MRRLRLHVLPRRTIDRRSLGRIITHRAKVSIPCVRAIQMLGHSVSTHRHAVCIGMGLHTFVGRRPSRPRFRLIRCGSMSTKGPIIIMKTKPNNLFTTLHLVRLNLHPVIVRHKGGIHRHGGSVTLVDHRRGISKRSGCDFNRKKTNTCSSNGLCAHDGGQNSISGVLGIFYRFKTDASVLTSTRPRVNASGLPHIVRGVHRRVVHYNKRIRFRAQVSTLIVQGKRIMNIRAGANRGFLKPIVLTANRSTQSICHCLRSQRVPVRTGNVTINIHLRRPRVLVSRVRCRHGRNEKGCLPTTRCDFITRINKQKICSFYVYPNNFIIPTTDDSHRIMIGKVSPSGHNSH